MKLIVQNNRIVATATDAYNGPDQFVSAPEGFDAANFSRYEYVDGELRLSVPKAVTMRQARLALLGAGLLDEIDSAINALPSPQKEAARIEWEYSQEVQRYNGFVSILAPSLGLSEAQTDNLFIQALTL